MRSTMLALVVLGALAAPAGARAQQQTPPVPQVKITEETPGLMARARVPGDSAIALARSAVPKGRITKAELEEEDGKLIYSFDMRVAGKAGVYEVHVDAMTGAVGPVEHEEEGGGGR